MLTSAVLLWSAGHCSRHFLSSVNCYAVLISLNAESLDLIWRCIGKPWTITQCRGAFLKIFLATLYTVDQRETVEDIEINISWWLILVQERDKTVLDHGPHGRDEERWTDLRYIYKTFGGGLNKGRGLWRKRSQITEGWRIEEMMWIDNLWSYLSVKGRAVFNLLISIIFPVAFLSLF